MSELEKFCDLFLAFVHTTTRTGDFRDLLKNKIYVHKDKCYFRQIALHDFLRSKGYDVGASALRHRLIGDLRGGRKKWTIGDKTVRTIWVSSTLVKGMEQ